MQRTSLCTAIGASVFLLPMRNVPRINIFQGLCEKYSASRFVCISFSFLDLCANNVDNEKCFDFLCGEQVLRGSMYRTKSDMYSLGLMAWELWNQDRAMKTQRKASLEQFIKTVRPTMMAEDEDNPFGALIKASLQTRPEDRLCATNWVNEIRKIDLSAKDDDDEVAEAQ